SIDEAYDQYTLVADQEKLSQHGLSAIQIGMNLGNVGEEPVLTTVKHDGKDINVYIEVEEIAYDSIEDLTDIEVETPLGTTVAIADVVEVQEGKSPEAIDRRDGRMYASLSANILGNDVDRKSTRLNSSHVSISYAVFCLKKKNKERYRLELCQPR